jgi:hypothetical protein
LKQSNHLTGTTKGTKSTKNQHIRVHRTHRIDRKCLAAGPTNSKKFDLQKKKSNHAQNPTAPAARRLSSLRELQRMSCDKSLWENKKMNDTIIQKIYAGNAERLVN